MATHAIIIPTTMIPINLGSSLNDIPAIYFTVVPMKTLTNIHGVNPNPPSKN